MYLHEIDVIYKQSDLSFSYYIILDHSRSDLDTSPQAENFIDLDRN